MTTVYLARATLRHPDMDEEIFGVFTTKEAADAACKAHAAQRFYPSWCRQAPRPESLNERHYDYWTEEVTLFGELPKEERIGPFVVRRRDGVPILECPEYLDEPRREDDEKKLFALVDTNDRVVCDVSQSVEISSHWLKFLCRLSERAGAAGKNFVLVEAQDEVRESADYLGIAERLFR